MNGIPGALRKLFPHESAACFWLVGGAVRDQLLGVACHDFDVVAVVTAQALTAAGFREVVARWVAWLASKRFAGRLSGRYQCALSPHAIPCACLSGDV